jgi:hypothetical protein
MENRGYFYENPNGYYSCNYGLSSVSPTNPPTESPKPSTPKPMTPKPTICEGCLADKLVALARKEVGVVEVPLNSNLGPKVKEYKSATWSDHPDTPFPWLSCFLPFTLYPFWTGVRVKGNPYLVITR